MKHEIMTTKEVTGYLKVARQTLYLLIKKGLPAHKITSQSYRFFKAEIDAWLTKMGPSLKVKTKKEKTKC